MKPLRIYLDTSDYEIFCRCNHGTEEHKIFKFLKKARKKRQIEIGYSYPIVWELLQGYKPEHKDSRIQRARMVSALCGRNAFRFFSDIEDCEAFSHEGHWYPGERHIISIERIVQELMSKFKSHPLLSDYYDLRNRKRLAKKHSDFFDSRGQDLPFPPSFIEGNMYYKYMCGQITAEEANTELNKVFTDLQLFMTVWYEHAKLDNPVTKSMHDIMDRMVPLFELLRGMFPKLLKMRSEMRKLSSDLIRGDPNYPVASILREKIKEFDQIMKIADYVPGASKIMQIADGYPQELLAAYFLETYE